MSSDSDLTWVELAADGQTPIRIFKSRGAAFASGRQIGSFYSYSVAVSMIRHMLWIRCKGECEICAAPVTELSGHMHEQKHRGKGGEISLANSVFICPTCHQRDHGDRQPRWKNSMEKRLDIQKGFRQSTD